MIDFFISPKLTIGLFATLIWVLVPATFSKAPAAFLHFPAILVLTLIAINLTACTLSRLKSLKASTLFIHCGVLIILVGGLINDLGFVATVNIFTGDSVNKAFRWDLEKDTALGFDLRIAAINFDYYPVAVKVGIMNNGRKENLVVTRTGESFVFEKYRVQVASLNHETSDLELAVQSLEGGPVGTLSTSGTRDLPADFPLDFKLVAFQTPDIKRIRVDLELFENGELVASGTSEANHPFRWRGMQFFLTRVTTDEFNRRYAGIQISRAPGIPCVYGGFAVFFLGLFLSLGRWLQRIIRSGSPRS
ncbi:MAG: cytochrome c biogenesis protein ResB [Proteobacteria bacterium]|nr:cytochrome c biogenesis protein ResB [Pseudomonadota bacterium]MBU1737212.1 cytochrome c biogenesis protein ResB [Pseudomonadota bacterium]